VSWCGGAAVVVTAVGNGCWQPDNRGSDGRICRLAKGRIWREGRRNEKDSDREFTAHGFERSVFLTTRKAHYLFEDSGPYLTPILARFWPKR
jgi:hypothetical protein